MTKPSVDWLAALELLVADGVKVAPADQLFGEDCPLAGAARQAIAGGAEQRQRFLNLVGGLDVDAIAGRYGQHLADLAAVQQGKLLSRGMIAALTAGCHLADAEQSRDDAQSARRKFSILAAEAVDHYSSAWPDEVKLDEAQVKNELAKLNEDPCFSAYSMSVFNGQPEPQGTAFWVVWDLIDRLTIDVRGGNTFSGVVSSASTPVLTVSGDGKIGKAGWLTVELIQDGGRGFHPDPKWLGLTALVGAEADKQDDDEEDVDKEDNRQNVDIKNDDFLAAMRNAWQVSGVAEGGYRARWRITTYHVGEGEPNEEDQFFTPYLTGDSCGAAACCALWAANGGVPGSEKSAEERRHMKLDEHGAITAALPSDAPEPQLGQTLLKPVGGTVAKWIEARRREIDLVIIAPKEQDRDDVERIIGVEEEEKRRELGGQAPPADRQLIDRPHEYRTINEAFEKLLALNRYLGPFHDSVKSWEDEWRPDSIAEMNAARERELAGEVVVEEDVEKVDVEAGMRLGEL